VLTAWPTVERDDQQQVIAFSGLTLRPTEHRLDVTGRALHAWCAWDALFLPAMLGQPARVRSRCPITGADIHLTVAPGGVQASDPAPLAVSFPPPDALCVQDITSSFCCHVHFLAGAHAAERWRADHGGALVLDLDEVCRRVSTRRRRRTRAGASATVNHRVSALLARRSRRSPRCSRCASYSRRF
jgi:alkylmercury lyase